MRRPTEDRMAPDPRNVGTIITTVCSGVGVRHVETVRNFEERDAFASNGNLHLASTVGEIRRGGLRDVDVICPRDIEVGGYLVARRGEVISWQRAVALGIVED